MEVSYWKKDTFERLSFLAIRSRFDCFLSHERETKINRIRCPSKRSLLSCAVVQLRKYRKKEDQLEINWYEFQALIVHFWFSQSDLAINYLYSQEVLYEEM